MIFYAHFRTFKRNNQKLKLRLSCFPYFERKKSLYSLIDINDNHRFSSKHLSTRNLVPFLEMVMCFCSKNEPWAKKCSLISVFLPFCQRQAHSLSSSLGCNIILLKESNKRNGGDFKLCSAIIIRMVLTVSIPDCSLKLFFIFR